jgi:hypothetical protein
MSPYNTCSNNSGLIGRASLKVILGEKLFSNKK